MSRDVFLLILLAPDVVSAKYLAMLYIYDGLIIKVFNGYCFFSGKPIW